MQRLQQHHHRGWQGLIFRGQTANFSNGYIVQLDSLLAQASPHVSNRSSSPSSTRPPPPPPPTLSLIFRASPRGGAAAYRACAWVVTLATVATRRACPENLVSARKCLNELTHNSTMRACLDEGYEASIFSRA